MKSTLGLVFVLLGMFSLDLQAQTARLVHYQGTLLDSDGAPFTGTTDLHFAIYTRPMAQQPIWSETHRNVPVNEGRYEVLLGSENPLSLSFYEYYLEVKAAGTDQPAQRVPIAGSGFNYRMQFLFAAYTIVWLAIFLYLVTITRRQKKIISELELLAQSSSSQVTT